jgi:hypothetical protein
MLSLWFTLDSTELGVIGKLLNSGLLKRRLTYEHLAASSLTQKYPAINGLWPEHPLNSLDCFLLSIVHKKNLPPSARVCGGKVVVVVAAKELLTNQRLQTV